MISVGVWVVSAFLAGVLVGILLHDAFVIAVTGKGFIMHTARSFVRRPPRLSARTLGIALVTVALVANALVGFLSIATRSALERSVKCQETYNRAAGDARDERDVAIIATTDEEIALWSDYLVSFRAALAADDAGDARRLRELQVDFAKRVRDYRDKLRAIQRTRAVNPYPDPALCRKIGR